MPVDCEPGDVILTTDTKPLSLVSAGQAVVLLNPFIALSTSKGSIHAVHAAIGIGTAKAYNSDRINVNQVAHATGDGGICRGSLAAYGNNIRVFRLRRVHRKYAEAAHTVALRWTEVRGMAYSTSKAFMPAFGMSVFGPAARERARYYHQHRGTQGGPPGMSQEKKSMYCSMFAIAVYQAALGEGAASVYMALDAKYTSPMKLQDYLATHPMWEAV